MEMGVRQNGATKEGVLMVSRLEIAPLLTPLSPEASSWCRITSLRHLSWPIRLGHHEVVLPLEASWESLGDLGCEADFVAQ